MSAESSPIKGKNPTQPFTPEERTSPLINGYFGFNSEDREAVRSALKLATKILPIAGEYNAAIQQGSAGEKQMEKKYGLAADTYAGGIDPSFSATKNDNNSKTVDLRRKFYKMIHTLTVEQVEAGAQRIIEVEENDPWGHIGLPLISSD